MFSFFFFEWQTETLKKEMAENEMAENEMAENRNGGQSEFTGVVYFPAGEPVLYSVAGAGRPGAELVDGNAFEVSELGPVDRDCEVPRGQPNMVRDDDLVHALEPVGAHQANELAVHAELFLDLAEAGRARVCKRVSIGRKRKKRENRDLRLAR